MPHDSLHLPGWWGIVWGHCHIHLPRAYTDTRTTPPPQTHHSHTRSHTQLETKPLCLDAGGRHSSDRHLPRQAHQVQDTVCKAHSALHHLLPYHRAWQCFSTLHPSQLQPGNRRHHALLHSHPGAAAARRQGDPAHIRLTGAHCWRRDYCIRQVKSYRVQRKGSGFTVLCFLSMSEVAAQDLSGWLIYCFSPIQQLNSFFCNFTLPPPQQAIPDNMVEPNQH